MEVFQIISHCSFSLYTLLFGRWVDGYPGGPTVNVLNIVKCNCKTNYNVWYSIENWREITAKNHREKFGPCYKFNCDIICKLIQQHVIDWHMLIFGSNHCVLNLGDFLIIGFDWVFEILYQNAWVESRGGLILCYNGKNNYLYRSISAPRLHIPINGWPVGDYFLINILFEPYKHKSRNNWLRQKLYRLIAEMRWKRIGLSYI